jgi:hypothetical protein
MTFAKEYIPQSDTERKPTAAACCTHCERGKTRERTMSQQNECGKQAKINSEAYNQTYIRIAATNSPTYERMNKNNELKVTENMR